MAHSWSECLEFCDRKSKLCIDLERDSKSVEHYYARCVAVATDYNLNPPHPNDFGGNVLSCIKRLCSKTWWRKAIKTMRSSVMENTARDLRLVSKNSGAYASNIGVNNRAREILQNRYILENTFATNQHGQTFSLQELSDKSISNPEIRKAELMTRLNGFETVAKSYRHRAEFYTVTTPSRMHAVLSNGQPNPKFDGTTPKEANTYLAHIFKLIRSKLAREEIRVYGFRVSEPHHDGTPHWHYLLYMHPSDRKTVRKIFRHYSLKDNPDEAGARTHRFKFVEIDESKGSATGYIAKYISKNIGGEDLETDLYGEDAAYDADRAGAWSSIHGIRQFQQIGGPPVGVWRELRRMKCPKGSGLEEAWIAADSADWAAYVMVTGGPTLPRADRNISLYHEHRTAINPQTGEIPRSHFSRYGDLKKPPLRGLIVKATGEKVISRTLNWKIENFSPSIGIHSGHGPPRAGPHCALPLDSCQ
ncbi:MAG: replication endonuclease [Pseudomonadales bacterium]|nr:replication endonuclease [Pseudomonadales bacterium]